ncbi:hypothetical protein [Helicobacter pylori]
METELFYFHSITTTKRVLRRFKKGLKNKFVLLKDDKGIKEYPK